MFLCWDIKNYSMYWTMKSISLNRIHFDIKFIFWQKYYEILFLNYQLQTMKRRSDRLLLFGKTVP